MSVQLTDTYGAAAARLAYKTVERVSEAGLRVVERVPLEVSTADAAARYLRTKKEKMGHLLELV